MMSAPRASTRPIGRSRRSVDQFILAKLEGQKFEALRPACQSAGRCIMQRVLLFDLIRAAPVFPKRLSSSFRTRILWLSVKKLSIDCSSRSISENDGLDTGSI